MAYTTRVFNSVAEIDQGAWRQVCASAGDPLFMDLRFVAAVEAAMQATCRFWYVVVDAEGARPVACAGLATMTVDMTDFGDKILTWLIRHGPPFLARLKHLTMLFCSLPGSPGDKSLALAPGADAPQVMAALDALMSRLAGEGRLDAIVVKELAPADLGGDTSLLQLGYQRIDVPPMHLLDSAFASFADYYGAMRSHYRKQIKRSLRKLATSGVVARVITDRDEILRTYTPTAHAMYLDMVGRSDVKPEVLPIEYFQELARRLEGQVELIALMKDGRLVAFGWCAFDAASFHMMYAGLDYALNDESDLYFNMVYAAFDSAFRKRVAHIHVGQTATVFKSRMGCASEPRFLYAKGLGFFMSRLFRYGSSLLVVKKPANPPADIFRRDDQSRRSSA